MRTLVTRWRKVGSRGRVGPSAAEVQVGRASGKLVIRIERDGQKMFVLAERIEALTLAWQIIKECRKLPK